MTATGRTIEIRRYRIPAGQRALNAQRIAGHVALVDVPVDHTDHVALVERAIPDPDELQGVAAAYAQHTEQAGVPAIIAARQAAAELAATEELAN